MKNKVNKIHVIRLTQKEVAFIYEVLKIEALRAGEYGKDAAKLATKLIKQASK